MEKEQQNNDHIYRDDMRNRKRTLQELHDAMIKSKEQDFEEEVNDPDEFELDAYNL